MDVRCERCSTEYELEDHSVPEGGCPVQCTHCGHTFLVTRGGVTPTSDSSPAPSADPPPPAADWLLETADGKLHRFRNLTSLQKWIIERKVTRDDKISRTGHAWRRLGEIVELGPFFDVVDEADRARAAQAAATELKSEAVRARTEARESGPVVTQGRRPSRAGASARSSSPRSRADDDEFAPISEDQNDGRDNFREDGHTAVVRTSPAGKIVLFFLVAGAVAAGAVYYLKMQDGGLPAQQPVAADLVAQTAPPVAQAPPPAPTPQGEVAVVAPAQPVAEDKAPEEKPPSPANLPGVAGGDSSEKNDDGSGPEIPARQALAQADRLLENGSTEKAFRLYERVLKKSPDDVQALTGLGYVMLDKARNYPAIGYFKRALGQSPTYGAALFGLGEAARSAGDLKLAYDSYDQYVRTNPSGVYGVAARRQASVLKDKLASDEPASAPEEDEPDPNPVAPSEPTPVAGPKKDERGVPAPTDPFAP